MSKSVVVGTLPTVSRATFALSSDARRGDMVDQASSCSELDVPAKLASIASAYRLQETEFERRRSLGVADICKDCEDPIPQVRRNAMPTAIRCTGCEETHQTVLKSKKR